MALHGTVKSFSKEKGFGFITPVVDGGGDTAEAAVDGDIFVHVSAINNNKEDVGSFFMKKGEAVTYDKVYDEMKGKWSACNVTTTTNGSQKETSERQQQRKQQQQQRVREGFKRRGQHGLGNTNEDDDDNQRMAKDDGCWDGNWLAAGLMGMYVAFNDGDFLKDQLEDFLFDNEQKPGGHKLRFEDEFLDMPRDEMGWQELFQEKINPRNLHVSSAVVRRWIEGCCPSIIRIKKFDSEDMEALLENKKLGNDAFAQKDYLQAIEFYEEALSMSSADQMFVGPKDQVLEIVNVLSNQAECYLRLKQYDDAGISTTDALMFDSSNEKSRLRRAKAELAIGNLPHLVQARVDLQGIVDEKQSEVGVKQAKQHLKQLESRMKKEKKIFEQTKPNLDWDKYVESMESCCW